MQDAHRSLPLISIVVPSYNQAGFLRDTFESIFRQNYPRLEVVVMDGGSTDGSVDIIREYAPHLKHWQSQKDGGQSAAINAGMQHCSGELVGWLNSDDYFWGDCLWTLARAYHAHPGFGLYVGNGLRYVQSERRYYPFCTRHVAFARDALLRGVDSILQPATFFLRDAWESVGGLRNELRFCMDWDIYLRITQTYPVVVLNDFLAVSREYEDTKTRTGKMERAAEIVRMIRQHTGEEVTPGTLLYLFETLRDVIEGVTYPEAPPCIRRTHEILAFQVSQTFGGGGHPFPDTNDSQAHVYVPLPREGEPRRPYDADVCWPTISLVCRVEDANVALDTAQSVLRQNFPSLELIFVGASHIVEELARHHPGSKAVGCEPSLGPVESLRRGLAAATGELLGWLEPHEVLTQGALAEVGRVFAADPALDAVLGNALYTDAEGQPAPFQVGRFPSALSLGVATGLSGLVRYWLTPSLTPPPGLFFRRRVLDWEGGLDTSRRHTYAHVFLALLVRRGKVSKLERTQILRRTPFNPAPIETELYARGRPNWWAEGSREFLRTWRSFLGWYMRRHYGNTSRRLRFWLTAGVVGTSALFSLGNPEAFAPRSRSSTSRTANRRKPIVSASQVVVPNRRRLHVTACLTRWPHDGRESAFLDRLKQFARLDCFLIHANGNESADAIHTPETLRKTRPRLVRRRGLLRGVLDWLRRSGLPVPGSQMPIAITENLRTLQTGLIHLLQLTVQNESPDVLLVASEDNPTAALLQVEHPRTRIVLLARRIGIDEGLGWAEATRARHFERRNLAMVDGIVVARPADRDVLVELHGFSPERVALLGSEGDVEYLDGHGEHRRGVEAWLAHLGKLARRGRALAPDLPVIGPTVREGATPLPKVTAA